MKKKILVVLLLLMPFIVCAENTSECNYSIFVEYQKASMNIEYETSYSVKNEKFTVKFYNVIDGIYMVDNIDTYSSDSDNTVTLNNIEQGSTLSLTVNTVKTSCNTSLRTIRVSLPYFNTFYDTVACEKYKNKLSICSSKFLNYEPTEDLLESMIENYDKSIQPDEPVEPDVNRTFLDDIKDFTIKWGIQILLVVISSGVTIVIFNAKLRKVKHGI